MTSIYEYRTLTTPTILPPKPVAKPIERMTESDLGSAMRELAKSEKHRKKLPQSRSEINFFRPVKVGLREGSLAHRALGVLKVMGQATSVEISEALPDVSRKQATSALSYLSKRNYVVIISQQTTQTGTVCTWGVAND